MNQESWGNLLTIVGGVLLSVELFKSGREEKDEAVGWWDGNPFQAPVRKAIGFLGLLLLITGFAIGLNVSLEPGTVETNAAFWFIASIVLGSTIVIGLAYYLVGPLYERRRLRHFARLALELIEEHGAGTANPLQLYNGLLGCVPELREAYRDRLAQLYSEMNLFQNIVPDGSPMSTADRARYVDAIVIRKKDSFGADLGQLEKFLKSVR